MWNDKAEQPEPKTGCGANRSPVVGFDHGKRASNGRLGFLFFFLTAAVACTTARPAAAPEARRVAVETAAACSFGDVPPNSPFLPAICKLVTAGITAGCGGGNFCPNGGVTGAQMAVFLMRGEHGATYQPPACAGGMFVDVACPNVFADWIEQCAREGVCYGQETGPTYCPSGGLHREKVAVELLRGKHGGAWTPPAIPLPCRTARVFADVGCAWWFTGWVEELSAEGITAGCATNPKRFCPLEGMNRAQMAVYIVATFGL